MEDVITICDDGQLIFGLLAIAEVATEKNALGNKNFKF
jgi:hypothetical protein